jgi:RES domain-containing protein
VRVWRIAGAAHPVWSGEGARLYGARWNAKGMPAIYCGTSYAIAALEILVHANRLTPPLTLRFVVADIPDTLQIERATPSGWNAPDITAAQEFGATWLREARTAVLLVPSVVTGGEDWNAVINPAHRDVASIAVSEEREAPWDARLVAAARSARGR